MKQQCLAQAQKNPRKVVLISVYISMPRPERASICLSHTHIHTLRRGTIELSAEREREREKSVQCFKVQWPPKRSKRARAGDDEARTLCSPRALRQERERASASAKAIFMSARGARILSFSGCFLEDDTHTAMYTCSPWICNKGFGSDDIGFWGYVWILMIIVISMGCTGVSVRLKSRMCHILAVYRVKIKKKENEKADDGDETNTHTLRLCASGVSAWVILFLYKGIEGLLYVLFYPRLQYTKRNDCKRSHLFLLRQLQFNRRGWLAEDTKGNCATISPCVYI